MKIYFLPVTENNYLQILELKIQEYQKGFIESTNQCMEEAKKLSLWHPMGIYMEETLIGFAMYGLWENEGEKGRVWLDRFLIDKVYQGRGYGKAAIYLLIKLILEEYGCKELYLSLYEDNETAIYIYKKAGFQFNGEIDLNGEKIMVLRV